MARKVVPAKEHVPPTLTVQRAIELIGRRLQQFDTVIRLRREDPEVDKWTNTTEQILRAAFGEPHGNDHEMLHKSNASSEVQQFIDGRRAGRAEWVHVRFQGNRWPPKFKSP